CLAVRTLPDGEVIGSFAYFFLSPRVPDAGRCLIASFSSFPSTEVVPDARALESSVRFAPSPQALLVTREALGAATPSATPSPSFRPSPSATASPTPGPVPSPPASPAEPGGIWLLNLVSGTN